MHDWRHGQVRYLIHFDDGGSGMPMREAGTEWAKACGERLDAGREVLRALP